MSAGIQRVEKIGKLFTDKKVNGSALPEQFDIVRVCRQWSESNPVWFNYVADGTTFQALGEQ